MKATFTKNASSGSAFTYPEDEYEDTNIAECRTPSKSHMQQARLLNVSEREVCVSTRIERITARSYRYLNQYDELSKGSIRYYTIPNIGCCYCTPRIHVATLYCGMSKCLRRGYVRDNKRRGEAMRGN